MKPTSRARPIKVPMTNPRQVSAHKTCCRFLSALVVLLPVCRKTLDSTKELTVVSPLRHPHPLLLAFRRKSELQHCRLYYIHSSHCPFRPYLPLHNSHLHNSSVHFAQQKGSRCHDIGISDLFAGQS